MNTDHTTLAAAAPEPLAAILAEMREYASVDMNAEGPRVAKWADRIDAAAKRERETADLRAIHAAEMAERDTRRELAPGNAAAMRAALQNLCDCTSCDWACIGQTNYDPCDETCLKCTGRPARDNDCPWIQARAALSAPARNCDRFDEYHDAVDAWHREERCLGRHQDGGTCEKDPLASTLAPVCFARWLFAPAKGGAE